MNSKERFEAVLDGNDPDHVPCIYQYLTGGPALLKEMGLDMGRCYRDPESFAKACLGISKRFEFDNVVAGWGSVLLEAHALGTEIEFLDGERYPQATKPAIGGPEDLDSFHPVDPMDDELLSTRIKATGILNDMVGNERAVMASVLSPLAIASEVRGYETMLMDLFVEQDMVHSYLNVITETVIMYAEAVAAQGVEMIFFEDDATASDQYYPIQTTIEFDLNYAKTVMGHFEKLGLRTIVHNCTDHPLVVKQMEMLKPDALHFNASKVHLDEIIRNVCMISCMIPGVDETLVNQGGVDRIEAEVVRLADIMSGCPFALGAAYEIPFNTPYEHIEGLVNAVRSYEI